MDAVLPSPLAHAVHRFPRTRYQGSKRRLADAIVDRVAHLPHLSVLDAFGGTGAVAHAFKRAGKRVTYNDVLAFNHLIGVALIENDSVHLGPADVVDLGRRRRGVPYDDFIERTFDGIYFTGPENRWLDTAVANIGAIECRYKRVLAWHALFQSAMAKRPYNLFHRSNLYMRTAQVPRGFGNKASWDRGFEEHLAAFAEEANRAIVDGRGRCRAICTDALAIEEPFDLVYIDPPYVNARGMGVDYRHFYHFLEGLVRYDDWPRLIDMESKHRRLALTRDPWSDHRRITEMMGRLLYRFRGSILVLSYRSDGIPAHSQIESMMRGVKRHVTVQAIRSHSYALSTQTGTRELLFIGTD